VLMVGAKDLAHESHAGILILTNRPISLSLPSIGNMLMECCTLT